MMQSSHIQVPLKNLRPGHEAPNHPGNARVTGREDGIAELAAHIQIRGKIDDLLVYDDGVPEIYFVANGNRSLQALRMMYGDNSEQLVDCKLTTAERAFEDSLAVAVTAKKFHPVDEFEAFAKLRDQHGKTEEEIGRQYGMTAREVQQTLALGGSLSPHIRDLWRDGRIKTEVVYALPMAGDHADQDKLLKKLNPDGNYQYLSAGQIKRELKIDQAGRLVEFVGIEAYTKAGGKVVLDLFGADHKVSNAKLAKRLADEKLERECEALVAAGWGFALPSETIANARQSYSNLNVQRDAPSAQERLELDQIEALLPVDAYGDQLPFGTMTGKQRAAYLRKRQILLDLEQRPFTPEMKAKAGCAVSIDDDGLLEVSVGWVKREDKAAASRAVNRAAAEAERDEADDEGEPTSGATKPKPAPTVISNALRERLEAMLISATKDAVLAALDTDLLKSPLAQVLARLVCSQINVNGASIHIYSHGVKDKLPAMREALPAALFNAAIAKHFDAADYFGNAPKPLVVKAIAEAINPDEARKAAAGSKADLAKFAIANVGKSGWLPKELRTPHYAVGAPVAKAKAAAAGSAKPQTTAAAVRKAKAERETKRAANVQKRVAKTQAKKTAKKKR
jgi:ParB family chromosome partitioning protein